MTVTSCQDAVHALGGGSELRITRLCSIKRTASENTAIQVTKPNHQNMMTTCFIIRDFVHSRDDCISRNDVFYFFGPRVHETEPATF